MGRISRSKKTCHTLTDIPSVSEIRQSVTKASPLGLQFPFPHTDRQYAQLEHLLQEMAKQLPDHSVFLQWRDTTHNEYYHSQSC